MLLKRRSGIIPCITPGLGALLAVTAFAAAGSANALPVNNFVLSNIQADGFSSNGPSALVPGDANSFDLTGGNDGGGLQGETDFLWHAPSDGTVSFKWAFTSCFPAWQSSPACDTPTSDWGGYEVGVVQTQLTDTDTGNILTTASFHVSAGSSFGWYVGTLDNLGEPGTLSVSAATFTAAVSSVPEPGSWLLLLAGAACFFGWKRYGLVRKQRGAIHRNFDREFRQFSSCLALGLLVGVEIFGQIQNSYTGVAVTGQLHFVTTTNLTQLSSVPPAVQSAAQAVTPGPELPRFRVVLPLPPTRPGGGSQLPATPLPAAPSLAVAAAAAIPGFAAMTHRDQRQANNANQFSVEPPNPSIASAGGKILEGVNNAVRVFASDGTPLTAPVSSNQLFGVGPAIDRTTNVYGVYPTDMRVFFDQDISRWFVLQRSQDEDTSGNPLNQSHIYLAVSQTSDPAGDYRIYIMDTANAGNFGCPCVDDYPQIGADRYGLYISSNEYGLSDPSNPSFNDATLLAVSKADLASGIATPTAIRFVMRNLTGYEFSIQPATTPPGAQPLIASGGVEYLVSSYPVGFDTNLALWALSNTASLQSASPNLLLTQTTVPALPHTPPPASVPQKSGPLTLGSTLERLDAGAFSDSRVLSTSYAGGRLYVTLATAVVDSLGNNAAGGLYVVFSPTLRGGVLGATAPVKQGYLSATSNHILRPAIAVNALGKGVIAFTLTGNDYYPSSAFVNIDLTPTTPSVVQVAAAGALPEDGFSGYGNICPPCIARWGDYSTAVVSNDGSIWFVNEYIPNATRTPLANWGTFISKIQP